MMIYPSYIVGSLPNNTDGLEIMKGTMAGIV